MEWQGEGYAAAYEMKIILYIQILANGRPPSVGVAGLAAWGAAWYRCFTELATIHCCNMSQMASDRKYDTSTDYILSLPSFNNLRISLDDLLSDLRQTRLANQKQGETKHEDTEKEASHPPLHSPASSSSSASPAKEGKEHKKEEQTEKREKRKHEKRQGKDRVAMIDVVCENGLRWVKVRATNPKNLRTSVEGESLFGASFLWGLCWLL